MVAIHEAAEAGHAVDAADTPAGAGLLQSAADHVFARAFDLPAADRTAFGETVSVIQMAGVRSQVSLQRCEGCPFWT